MVSRLSWLVPSTLPARTDTENPSNATESLCLAAWGAQAQGHCPLP